MTGKAEEQRQVKPDPLHPATCQRQLRRDPQGTDGPRGWHYVRQAEVTAGADAPEGKHAVTFTNSEPGRGSQALQAFPVDGRKVDHLEV